MSSGGETSSGNPAEKEKLDALYEDREPKKIIRIITVTAYMVSVSFVGIVLSAYYIFLWHPPNPRLMHAQSMKVQADPRRDLLVEGNESSPATRRPALYVLANAAHAANIDVFSEPRSDGENLKMRRQILDNVNAILRAKYDKSRAAERQLAGLADELEREPIAPFNDTSTTIDEASTRGNVTSPNPRNELSPEEADGASEEDRPGSTSRTVTATRRAKGPGKKQHQTPFALKHLEVPIKSDGSRRRSSGRYTSPTTSGRLVPLEPKGSFGEKTTPLGSSYSSESPQGIESNPEEAMRSLYRILSTPSSQREAEYPRPTDLPAMPSISSEQFQAMPRAAEGSEEYRDSTLEPADDLMAD